MNKVIENALAFADDTKEVVIGRKTLSQTGSVFRRCFGGQKARIIADPTTFMVAGQEIFDHLRSEGITLCEEPFLFESANIHAEMNHVETLRPVIGQSDAIPIAVGSGTINDLVKYTSSLCNRSYMIVGTAASMDGYTSFGASIEYNACKQTFNCPAPRAVLVDIDVIARAPLPMNASGYADLIAKIPAAADWMLADLIGTEPIDVIAWELVQKSLRHWLSNPAGIAQGDETTLTSLIEGLIMSGLAMQKAKSSRTASGAEHQFSHLWDNQRHTYQGGTPSHGFKVGIGTISTSALYDRILRTFSEKTFEDAISNLPQTWRPWDIIEEQARKAFKDPGLLETVLKQCRLKFVDQSETRRRLELFRENWPELREKLRNQLMDAETVQRMIRESTAPSTPEEIGIDRPRLQRSYEEAQMLRCRYNVLDWILDLGLWEQMVPPLFAEGGFWWR